MFNPLESGAGHVYFALIGIIAIAIFAESATRWTVILALLAGGVFADLWAHEYNH